MALSKDQWKTRLFGLSDDGGSLKTDGEATVLTCTVSRIYNLTTHWLNLIISIPNTPPKDLNKWQMDFSYMRIISYSIAMLLDTNHWCISNKSVPLHHPLLYLPSPKSIPISITSPTLLHSSLFPLSHPLSLCSLFHWYPFLCHYDPLVSCLSFLPPIPIISCFTLVPFVPSPWPSQANPAA